MTWGQLLEQGKGRLQGAGIEEASLDAWYLMEYVTGMRRADFFLRQEETVLPNNLKVYLELVERRRQHIPLQHLTGRQEFMGLEFLVDSRVLVPRQETELLVEKLLPLVEGKRILDLCTGSGCIAVSLSALGAPMSVDAIDLSEEALQLARENAERLQVEVEFFQSNLFQRIHGKYDVIVSNPPYIATAVVKTLMPEVREHEPVMALDGGMDGLTFYRQIAEEAGEHLYPGGMVWVEIGYDQGESVRRLFREQGFQHVECYRDFSGKDRIISARGKDIRYV